jgi:signal transduction histidine kinase
MAIFRQPVRSRPIRLFLISMFAVPLVSLVGLWAFAASVTVPAAISDHEYNVTISALSDPGAITVAEDLPVEQEQTYLWLLGNRTASNASLLATRKTLDKALPGAEVALQSEDSLLSPTSKATLTALLADLGQLGSLRQSVDSGKLSPTAAFQAYSNIVDDEFQSYYAGTLDRGASLTASSIGATDATYSLEMAGREIALVNSALTANKGTMSSGARQLFISSMTNRRQLLITGLSLLSGSLRSGYAGAVGSPVYQRFEAIEDQIAASTGSRPIPVSPTTWESVSGQYLKVMQNISGTSGVLLQAQSNSSSSRLFTQAVLAGGVGLLAVLVSVFLLAWFGRKVTGDLTRLHASVRQMAEERLPRVVSLLRRGEDVDVHAESPPPGTSGIREIAQIARSFGTVQEAAVAATVQQARQRKGVNQVFLNISMRNQSLLHRQLGMLDAMERRTSDPKALADLFRLDHLTTRMRRHAEGLIILSGSTPGRGWRDPVPVVDVLRAAVAEVEDYVRVDVMSDSRDLVAGNAVNDVIHLVAELVENATVFSPPNTRIEVRADRAGTGLVAEIEDRGLGLDEEELADINKHLASPPEFDLANSEQLGLFVVSRLAARHDIRVSLRQSVYGGTTAILLLPFGVVVRAEEAGHDGGPAAEGQALRPAAGAPEAAAGEPPSHQTGPRGLPDFAGTGRHRLLSTVTGRRAQSEVPPGNLESATPWAGAWHRGTADRQTSRPAEQRRQESGQPGSHLGMPIRVPQASLAPQLQARRDAGARPTAREAPDIDMRSPETTRNMMITMQQGWRRGRLDDLDDPAGAPHDGTDR